MRNTPWDQTKKKKNGRRSELATHMFTTYPRPCSHRSMSILCACAMYRYCTEQKKECVCVRVCVRMGVLVRVSVRSTHHHTTEISTASPYFLQKSTPSRQECEPGRMEVGGWVQGAEEEEGWGKRESPTRAATMRSAQHGTRGGGCGPGLSVIVLTRLPLANCSPASPRRTKVRKGWEARTARPRPEGLSLSLFLSRRLLQQCFETRRRRGTGRGDGPGGVESWVRVL